jgi:transcriptional regulator with XRE-family HTH domain
MALGSILRDAREARGLSISDVAEHTNMMVQVVEELENEDFHRIAAPIYGRGFLKLYAELLDLDVQPLIDEFMDIYTGKVVPTVLQKEVEAPDTPRVPLARNPEEQPLESSLKGVPAAGEKHDKPASDQPAVAGSTEVSPPRHAPVVPKRAVRKLKTQPKPADDDNITAPSLASDKEAAELFNVLASDSEPQQPGKLPVMEDEQRHSKAQDGSAETPTAPGEELFSEDEPNLFNTSPLQERIAQARRLMQEKADGEQEEIKEKKNASLHLNPNQRLPVFQIGGRMEKVYEAERRKAPSLKRDLILFRLKDLSRRIGRIAHRITLLLPSDFDIARRGMLVYALLSLLVLALLYGGIRSVYRLTHAEPGGEEEQRQVMTEKVMPEKSSESVASVPTKNDQQRPVPPPPDMYID